MGQFDNPISNDAEELLRPHESMPMELARSAVYSGFQAPVNAVVQIVDYHAGTQILPKVQLIDPCEKAEFLSARWHTQQFGALFGTALNLLVLQKSVGWAGDKMLGHLENIAANQGQLAARSIREAAIAGFIHNGVFKPVTEADGNFYEARLRNGLVGAGSWAISTAAGLGIKHFGKTHDGALGTIMRNDVSSTVVSGIPSGIASAQLRSLLDGKGFAGYSAMWESVYSQSIVGGMWALGKDVIGGTRSDTQLRDHMRHASLVARGRTVPLDLLERVSPPVFSGLPKPKYDHMSDFPIRPR